MTTVAIPTTATDYEMALRRIERLMAKDDPNDDAELEALALLVENYEKKAFPIEEPDPIDMIQFRMAQLAVTPAEVARRTGIGRSHISEILNRKRPLSLEAIRKFSEGLGLPAQVLIQPYFQQTEVHARAAAAD